MKILSRQKDPIMKKTKRPAPFDWDSSATHVRCLNHAIGRIAKAFLGALNIKAKVKQVKPFPVSKLDTTGNGLISLTPLPTIAEEQDHEDYEELESTDPQDSINVDSSETKNSINDQPAHAIDKVML